MHYTEDPEDLKKLPENLEDVLLDDDLGEGVFKLILFVNTLLLVFEFNFFINRGSFDFLLM